MKFVTLLFWIGKTHSEGIDTFNIGVQCIQCLLSLKGSILLKFSRQHLDGLWNLWQGKNLAKNLEMTTTTINGLCGEFNFIFHSAKSQSRFLFICLKLTFLPQRGLWHRPLLGVLQGQAPSDKVPPWQEAWEPSHWCHQDEPAWPSRAICWEVWEWIRNLAVRGFRHCKVDHLAGYHAPHCLGYVWKKHFEIARLVQGQIRWDDPHYRSKACCSNRIQAVT